MAYVVWMGDLGLVVYNAPMIKQGDPKVGEGEKRLKLHYFFIRGACQPIRNLLYHLQIDFQDVLHERTKDNEVEVGFNLGFPMLEDAELRIHETVAIMVYICSKYNQQMLVGLTPQSIARVQEVLMKYCVQRKRIMAYIFEMFSSLPSKPEKKAYVDGQLKKMVGECKFLDYCLKSLALGKKYIMESLTLVDFIFYEQCFYICGFFQQYINKISIFKFFHDFKVRFEELPFFQRHRKQIEERCLFHEFNNPEMNKLIAQSWKGGKCGDILKKQPNSQ